MLMHDAMPDLEALLLFPRLAFVVAGDGGEFASSKGSGVVPVGLAVVKQDVGTLVVVLVSCRRNHCSEAALIMLHALAKRECHHYSQNRSVKRRLADPQAQPLLLDGTPLQLCFHVFDYART